MDYSAVTKGTDNTLALQYNYSAVCNITRESSCLPAHLVKLHFSKKRAEDEALLQRERVPMDPTRAKFVQH